MIICTVERAVSRVFEDLSVHATGTVLESKHSKKERLSHRNREFGYSRIESHEATYPEDRSQGSVASIRTIQDYMF